MELVDFRSQLETELEWRSAEMRFFQNLCEGLNVDDQRTQFRRALVLLLYSHFEGYCKFALSLYVAVVNESGLVCGQANSAIVAATLHDVFSKLRDGTGKAPEFRNSLPDDSKLHRYSREREFIERSAELMVRPVLLSDGTVDTESNLKPAVLRKNLYRLGLPHDQFDSHQADIDRLLSYRNRIAHGETRQGLDANVYDELRESAFHIMTGVTVGLSVAVHERWFLAS